MSEAKSVVTMSTRDSKVDYIRARPRKDKDRDNSDKRSSILGTGGIIVRKHRDSTTSRSVAPSDSASQVGTETPAQSSSDAPSLESDDTSTLLKSNSTVSLTSRMHHAAIQTPATLQPYLETEVGDGASFTTPEISRTNSEAGEQWIGPSEEAVKLHGDDESSVTPKPIRRAPSEKKRKGATPRSSVSPEGSYENPFLSSQTANSFLSVTTNANPPATSPIPIPAQPYHQPYSQPPPSPVPTWHDAPSQRSSSVVSASRHVTSDPTSMTTYMAHAQPRMLPPQENPMMLLQRVSSAMPDIYMLMQNFHESCATIGLRESHIRQLEMQKDADARRQDSLIERVTKDAEAMIAKNAARVDRLETKISKLEDAKASLQRSLAKEEQAKEDAQKISENARAEQKQLAMKYMEETQTLTTSHSKEKNRLISDHAASHRALSDHAQAQARIAEANMSARLGELKRFYEHERQAIDERRVRERGELEKGHAQTRRDLEDAVAAKVKVIEDERRDSVRMRQTWEKEYDDGSRRRDEERARHRKDLEEQYHDLTRKYHREKDEAVKSMEASYAASQAKHQAVTQEHERARELLSRQAADAQNTISRLQRDAESHKRYTSEAQETLRKLQKENTDMRSALESALSQLHHHQYQQQPEPQDRTRGKHNDKDIQNRSRTPSRQRSDPQENVKLRREIENERGRNEDPQESIIKLRREPVDGAGSSKMARNNAEKKQAQSSSSSSSSSLSAAQKSSFLEGKSPLLQKTTSM